MTTGNSSPSNQSKDGINRIGQPSQRQIENTGLWCGRDRNVYWRQPGGGGTAGGVCGTAQGGGRVTPAWPAAGPDSGQTPAAEGCLACRSCILCHCFHAGGSASLWSL